MAEETKPVETATPPPVESTTEKIYEIGKGWVEKPANLEVANPLSKPASSSSEPPPAPAPEKTDPPAGGTEGANPPTEKKDTLPPPSGTFDKEKFSKYGIEKEEDVFSTLDAVDDLMKENEELKKRSTEVKHKSPTHEKLFNFLEQYPESTWNEVLKTGGEVLAIDVDAADGKKVLQEAFVLQHPMLSREDAIFEFEQEYAEKYNLKPKEEYEDPAKFEQDKRRAEIRKKVEEDKARQVVREAKSKLTVEKPATPAAAPAQAPAEQVQVYTREIDNVLNGTTKGNGLAYIDKDFIRVKSDEKGEPLINIQLPPDKVKELRETALIHVGNPGVYDKSGKIPNFDAAKGTLQLAFALWPDWISQQMAKQVDILANIKKAEQIASTTPDKVETTQGKDVKGMSSDEQFRVMAQKEKEAREKNQQQRR